MSTEQKHTEAFEKNAQQLQYAQPYPPQYYPQQQQMQVVQGQYPVVVSTAPQSAQFNTVSVFRDPLVVWSIFNLILLCPVLGIIALIFLSRGAKSDRDIVNESWLNRSLPIMEYIHVQLNSRSIFNLILLCPVLGIIALIFSLLSREAKDESRWEDARSLGQVAFLLNVLGVLGWIIIIIGLSFFGTVFGGVMKTFSDIEGDFSAITISDDWNFPTTRPTTVW